VRATAVRARGEGATPLQLLLFVVGLLTLAAGAEALIRGAVRVARALGISPFITARPEGEEIGRRAAALEHLNREHPFSNGTNGRHRRPCPEEMPS